MKIMNMKKQQGFTLIEVTISIALMTLMMIAVAGVMESTALYSTTLKDAAFLQERIDRILFTIREDLLQTKLIFEKGSSFEPALLFDPALAIQNLVMPDIGGPTGNELFGVDGSQEFINGVQQTNSEKTGNFLVFVKKEESARFDVNDDGNVDYTIDLYRIIAYYPSRIAGDNQFGTGYRSTLIRWQSDLFADFSQVNNVPLIVNNGTDDEEHQLRVLSLLVGNKSVTYLADFRQADVGDAFFEIATNGSGEPTGAINQDPSYAIIENTRNEMIVIPSTVTLAMPGIVRGGSNQPLNPAGNKYSTIDNTFPGGFEVQIIQFGDYTSLIRLTMVKKNSRGDFISRTGEMMIRSTFF